MLTFDNKANNMVVWPYRRNPNYLIVVVGEGRAGRLLGVGLCRNIKEHLVIFTDAYEFDTLHPLRLGRFMWDVFAKGTVQTRREAKERLGVLGFNPCAVDKLWPKNREEWAC